MSKTPNSTYLSPQELAEWRQLGLELPGVRTRDDLSRALVTLLEAMERERPDLIERIAEMAAAERPDIRLPPKLRCITGGGEQND